MQGLTQKAINTLHQFFDSGRDRTSADIATARIATTVLSAATRERQTAGAAEALSFMIARELASDKAQLERFLSVAMPQQPIVRAIPEVKEGSKES